MECSDQILNSLKGFWPSWGVMIKFKTISKGKLSLKKFEKTFEILLLLKN